jgi:hypothetical protein
MTVSCLIEVPTLSVNEIERLIIAEFKKNYKLVKGREWFCGDYQYMIADINTIISKYPLSKQLTVENEIISNSNSLNSEVVVEKTSKSMIKPGSFKGFLITVLDTLKVSYESLRFWIFKHSLKSIIKKDNLITYAIITVPTSMTTSSILRSLKSLIKNNFEKSPKNIIKTQKLDTLYQLSMILEKNFITIGIDKKIIFENIEVKGYTKKYLISLLQNNKTQFIDKVENIVHVVCKYCENKFTTVSNCNRHEKICKKNKENKCKGTSFNEDFNEFKKEMIDMFNTLNQQNQNITNNVNSNNKTLNSKINNQYVSKKDKLNLIKDMIDLDTFILNYKNDSKYHLSKDETQILIENTESMGIEGYGLTLYTYLLKKYCLQLEDINGKKQEYTDCILPFISADCSLRSHYERNQEGWILTSSHDKIKSLVNISDDQIYKNHLKHADYSVKRGKKGIVNVILRNAHYSKIEPELERLYKISQL